MLRSRWFALVILCAATLMIILDGTIVTVALPVIQADLGFTPASLSWVRAPMVPVVQPAKSPNGVGLAAARMT